VFYSKMELVKLVKATENLSRACLVQLQLIVKRISLLTMKLLLLYTNLYVAT